jgi:hypothetical protein
LKLNTLPNRHKRHCSAARHMLASGTVSSVTEIVFAFPTISSQSLLEKGFVDLCTCVHLQETAGP